MTPSVKIIPRYVDLAPRGHGNKAHRRLLRCFQPVADGTPRFEARPQFLPQWRALAAKSPATAEALAYRLAKLWNRSPITKQHPPSHSIYNP